MTEKKRFANIELLRCLAMVMVIVMHFLRESGSLLTSGTELLSARGVLATAMESFCIVAVNTYVFISGYYGAKSRFKPSKVVAFWSRVWFYALIIPLVLFFFGVPTATDGMGIYGLMQYLLPISSEHYWFASTYIYLLLLMPLLNRGMKAMSSRQSAVVIAILLFFFSVIKSIVPISLAFDRYGYDLSWFVCVYLVALWLGLHGGALETWLKQRCGKLYVGSSLLIFVMTLGLWLIIPSFGGISYYFTVPFHYNFVLCLIGAIGLFYIFDKITLKEGKVVDIIRTLGKYSFGVYLLHEHVDMRHLWYPALTAWMKSFAGDGLVTFVAELLFCVVILFVMGILVDFLREKFYVMAVKAMQSTILVKKIEQLDELFEKEL